MNVMLKLNLVQYSSIVAVLENMLSSVDLHGPTLLSDSSTSLWATLIRLKASENPSSAIGISERVLQWMFNKWTPSKHSQARTEISLIWASRQVR
jgi:ataxia telangiectasia mutated family protein